MPKDLDIDYKRQLYGSVAPYADHLLFHTGTSDWTSRVEDDTRYPFINNMKATLKDAMMKSFPKQSQNLLVTASSLTPISVTQNGLTKQKSYVSLMKAGLHVFVNHNSVQQQAFLKDLADNVASERGWDKEILRQQFQTQPIDEVVVLICGHEKRDVRCGVMGPLLQKEFQDKLSREGFNLESNKSGDSSTGTKTARVGLISHIGGHAFAGNVIIYVPSTPAFEGNELAGKGVWYGRVEPKHVEGILNATVRDGVVIDELLRGVV